MRIGMALAGLLLLAGAPAQARVASSSDVGFSIQSSIEVSADPASVYTLIATPARWWSSAYSHSGSATNMTIEAKAGGCFCEALPASDGKPAGSAEHGRVLHAAPGERLRLSAALGPLQAEAVTGTLDFALAPSPIGTKVTLTYVVGGYARQPMSQLAAMVDGVMTEQLEGLRRAADKK